MVLLKYMEKYEVEHIIAGVKDSINDLVRESVYEQTKSKDAEVSDLHKEILDQIGALADKVDTSSENVTAMKVTLDEHDVVIKEVMDIYKTSGHIKKVIIWLIFFIPSVAAFIGGVLYIKSLFHR